MADTAVDDVIRPGSAVEVRTRFDGRWAAGYVTEAVVPTGFVVRRANDGRVVPGVFDRHEVRAVAGQSRLLRRPSTAYTMAAVQATAMSSPSPSEYR